MKRLLWLLLLLTVSLWGEETADQAEIGRAIAALNQSPQPAGLFTADFDDAKDLAGLWRPTVTISHQPWGEATWSFVKAKITSAAVRFITPEVALADGAASGPDGKDSMTLLFVMKKEGDRWKIASIRLLPAPAR